MQRKQKPIRIKPQNRGKFTAKAKRSRMSDTEFAQKTLLSGSGASRKTRQEAQFATNARKFNHKRK